MEILIPELIDWSSASEMQRAAALCRPPIPMEDFQGAVAGIISRVRRDGDGALRELGEKYDGVILEQLEVTGEEWDEAESLVDSVVLQAMDEAIARITAFHVAGKPASISMETGPRFAL